MKTDDADGSWRPLAEPAYWASVVRDASTYHWERISWRGALLCLPIIAGWVFIGVLHAHERWVIYAIGGAVSASFGAFQKLGDSRVRPMALLLAGIAVATWGGNVAGHFGWYYSVALNTIWGYAFGILTMLGYGAWWLGLQWIIALLVYGSHAYGPMQATWNALAVVAGGISQVLFLGVLGRFTNRWFPYQDRPPLDPMDSLQSALKQQANPLNPGGKYGLRVAAAMGISTLISHFWALPNSYWIAMTAAILLKPDFHEASIRGVSRIVGTAAGAGITTVFLAFALPAPPALGCLLLLAIFCCLALMRVNYALFVAFVTAYVVIIFATIGLPEPIVALHRILATLVGATVALMVSLVAASVSKLPVENAAEQKIGVSASH